ncbi:hypothetical protein [Microbacterium sp. VKM Ac-2923]|nr:hypothetical protein [Microbacterium sp. VKM Ac-2923]
MIDLTTVPEPSNAFRVICNLFGCYMHNGACVNCCAPEDAEASE